MTVLEGRYELGRRIGGGGMAEVVEAYDRKLDRRVAVKFLRDRSPDPRARERFVREARMAAGLVDPNVVAVFDVGETGGRPFLVMELIDGPTLAEVLAERGSLPTDEALRIEDAVLAALAAAHERGLVHRDVKPGNVLLARDGRVKLADFGIAKATRDVAADLTGTGQLLGTPKYLSPEQVDGRDATPRSDVYAAGILLYEMLAGAPPFTGEHPVAVAVAHQRDPVPPLEQRRPGLPPAVLGVVDRALEKDPSRRYADAEAMRAALGRAPGTATDAGATTETLAAAAAATATRTLPAPPAPVGPAGTGRRRGLWIALVAGAVIGAVVLGALLLSGGASTGPDLAATATTTTLPRITTTTVSPTTTTALPTTIDGLIALLAANPTAYGPRGEDLLRGLEEAVSHPDPKGKRAEKLSEQVGEWVADGELDPTIGALAQQLLGVPASAPEGG